MKAYYYDDIEGDPRLPHKHPTAPQIPPTHLQSLGVEYHQPADLEAINTLARQRGYTQRDEITISRAAMGVDYEDKLRLFASEHMHEDEEIRFVVAGGGYFDVRDEGDGRWIRIVVGSGDLLVLPAGVYHRFAVDGGDYIKAMRLFKDEPKWTPLNRGVETEGNKFRREYVEKREVGFRGCDGEREREQAREEVEKRLRSE